MAMKQCQTFCTHSGVCVFRGEQGGGGGGGGGVICQFERMP